jgi:hypothetical protein
MRDHLCGAPPASGAEFIDGAAVGVIEVEPL